MDERKNAAELLAEVTVLDLEGKVVRLGGLWRERPLALVFVRHFGCLFCREQVAQLAEVYPEIQARGAALAAVGNGSVRDAAAFAEERGVSFPLYTDPRRLAYRAAGLRHGVGSTFSLKGPAIP